ncbi:unnamed protein product [Closterium sp. NIES-53]
MVDPVANAGVADTLEACLANARKRTEDGEYGTIPWAIFEFGIRAQWATEHPSHPSSPRPVQNKGGVDDEVDGGARVSGNDGTNQRGVIKVDGGIDRSQARVQRPMVAAGNSPMTYVTAGRIAPAYGYFNSTSCNLHCRQRTLSNLDCHQYHQQQHRLPQRTSSNLGSHQRTPPHTSLPCHCGDSRSNSSGRSSSSGSDSCTGGRSCSSGGFSCSACTNLHSGALTDPASTHTVSGPSASEVLRVGAAGTTRLVPTFVAGSGATSPTARLSFTLDSGASICFFHDYTDLTPLHTPVTVTLADPSI